MKMRWPSTMAWSLASAISYILGGVFFIAGSVYVIPNISVLCVSVGCTIDVALWYLVGCFFYFFAAIIDLGLQRQEVKRRSLKLFVRHGWFRFDPMSESILSGIIYFIGSILFLIGSALFFPSLNSIQAARLTFRSGSCMYIAGSSYGIIQLLCPSVRHPERDHDVRRRTMTHVDVESMSLFPDINLASDGSNNTASRASSNGGRMRSARCRCHTNSVVLGVLVKVTFICGSGSFLVGGILFSGALFLEGGILWLEGSVLFLVGSLISLTSIVLDLKKARVNRHTSFSSSTTPSLENKQDAIIWVNNRDQAIVNGDSPV